MNLGDFSLMDSEELKAWAQRCSPGELKAEVGKLLSDQISIIVPAISAKFDENWREKTLAILEGTSEFLSLEAAGKSMNIAQLIEVMRNYNGSSQKLSPIFVGVSPSLFTLLLVTASADDFRILQQESMTEPIQHHLAVLVSDMMSQIDARTKTIKRLQKKIESLDVSQVSRAEVIGLLDQIEQCFNFFLEIQMKASKALALAWHTNRLDLIDKLGNIKDLSQRSGLDIVGRPVPERTGLYLILEKKLNEAYEDPSYQAFGDDEPVLDALSKFSIWYLEDYWELGLLPRITSLQDLQGEEANRDALLKEVIENLKKIGLCSLKDLKKENIYSKRGLLDFILDTKFRKT